MVRLTEEQKEDIAYEEGRRESLKHLGFIRDAMLRKIVENDESGYHAFRERYVNYVSEDTGNFIGSLGPEMLKKLGAYDVLLEQVKKGEIAPNDANFQLSYLKKEYEECKENLQKLDAFSKMFIDASNGFIALATEFDEGRGVGEVRKNYEKIEVRQRLLKGKIKERYPMVSKLFE